MGQMGPQKCPVSARARAKEGTGAGVTRNVKGARASPSSSGDPIGHFIFLRNKSLRVFFPSLFIPSFDIHDCSCH